MDKGIETWVVYHTAKGCKALAGSLISDLLKDMPDAVAFSSQGRSEFGWMSTGPTSTIGDR